MPGHEVAQDGHVFRKLIDCSLHKCHRASLCGCRTKKKASCLAVGGMCWGRWRNTLHMGKLSCPTSLWSSISSEQVQNHIPRDQVMGAPGNIRETFISTMGTSEKFQALSYSPEGFIKARLSHITMGLHQSTFFHATICLSLYLLFTTWGSRREQVVNGN